MRRFRRRVEVAVFAALLSASTVVYAATAGGIAQSNVGKSSEQGKTESGEKSKSERETQNDTTEKGGGTSHKRDWGARHSVRKEASHTLDKMRSSSLNTSLNVVGLYAKAAKDAGVFRDLYIDDLLVTPIGRYITYRSNLQSVAGNNEVAERYLKGDLVRRYMNELYRTGEWILQNLGKAKKLQGIGVKDWEEIAALTARNDTAGLKAIASVPDLAGDCRFVGQYTKIKCGSCVLDVSYTKAMPELVCDGRGMFGPDSAGGVQVTVQASISASMKDAETQAQSDETFRGIATTMDDYVKWASTHGKAVEAAAVKRLVLSRAVKTTSGLQIALQAASDKADPTKVLGFLGVK